MCGLEEILMQESTVAMQTKASSQCLPLVHFFTYKVDRSISSHLRVSYELKWVLWCKFFGERRKYRRRIIEVEELISEDACVHNNFWEQKCDRSL